MPTPIIIPMPIHTTQRQVTCIVQDGKKYCEKTDIDIPAVVGVPLAILFLILLAVGIVWGADEDGIIGAIMGGFWCNPRVFSYVCCNGNLLCFIGGIK